MHDVLVLGSGAAGVSAALALAGCDVLVTDVGLTRPEGVLVLDPGDDRSRRDLLGARFESLHNLFRPYLSPKLKAPRTRFVIHVPEGAPGVRSETFDAQQSFARGGLANIWGAGVYRFTDSDLRGFPISVEDLAPDYDVLTRTIGVSGGEDDLAPFFGSANFLQPPLPLAPVFEALLGRWGRRRAGLMQAGLHLGRPRLAVLSQPLDGRPAYDGRGTEFFESGNPAIFNPSLLLARLCEEGAVRYRSGFLAERFTETADGVRVDGRDTTTGEPASLTARRLVLAAGALGTARLALASRDDGESRLPLLDNAVSYLPFVDPRAIGAPPAGRSFCGAALNGVYTGPLTPEPVQMTLYGMEGPLRTDFLFELPLPAHSLLRASRDLVPALVTVQIFYPDEPADTNTLQLLPDGSLEIRYKQRPTGALEAHLVKLFRKLGLLGSSRLCRSLAPGNSFHYAGSLPMSRDPSGPYATGVDGRLAGTRAVYVADAACFPRLPSKNHTFTIMAIAHRLGRLLREQVGP